MAPLSLNVHSCSICQGLVVDNRPDAHVGKRDNGDMATKGMLFEMTLSEMKAGARHDCDFCTWFLSDEVISRDTVISRSPADLPSNDIFYPVLLALQDSAMWVRELLGNPNPQNTLSSLDSEQSRLLDDHRLFAATGTRPNSASQKMRDLTAIEFFGLWNPQTRKLDYRTRHGFSVLAEQDDPAASVVMTRPIEASPASDASFNLMSSWLDHCQQHHDLCRLPPGSSADGRPVRFLEIDTASSLPGVRLRASAELDSTVPFAALSYCWGGDQPMKCVRANLQAYLVSITFSSLPPTIRDAITVCIRFGVRYLWIDALCIVQDDTDEKNVEMAKMPAIYHNADFVIAAARSDSVYTGFLQQREVDHDNPAFSLPFRLLCDDEDVLGSIKLLAILLAPEPIDERAWTFQERVLSRRTLEFGSRQTRWICQESKTSPDFRDGWRLRPEHYRGRHDTLEIKQLWETEAQRAASLTDADTEAILRLWNTVVEAYTLRKLSYNVDRPLAISGIAEVFGRVLRGQYRAGLWASNFLTAVQWQAQLGSSLVSADGGYQGPSWSWTSVNGPVDFPFFDLKDWRPELCQAEVVECTLDLVNDQAPFGAVRRETAVLKLRARIAAGVRGLNTDAAAGEGQKELVTFFGLNDSSGPICLATAILHSSEPWLENPAIPDNNISDTNSRQEDNAGAVRSAADSAERVSVTVLELQSQILGYSWQCHGLVLRKVPGRAGVYRRVGTFEYTTNRDGRSEDESAKDFERRVDTDLNWFKNLPFTLVTII